jgi:predicted transcriptional regulator
MKEAITAYIEREEALERLRQETMAGWKEYQTTGEYVSDEVMIAWLESWGTDSEGEPPALYRD